MGSRRCKRRAEACLRNSDELAKELRRWHTHRICTALICIGYPRFAPVQAWRLPADTGAEKNPHIIRRNSTSLTTRPTPAPAMDPPSNPAGTPVIATSPSQASPSATDGSRPAKRQKVTRACDRCKARKRRCNGELPCSVCIANNAECKYDAAYTRGRLVQPLPSSQLPATDQGFASRDPRTYDDRPWALDDDRAEDDGQYAGPSSAYAFLKRAWERFGRKQGVECTTASAEPTTAEQSQGVSVFSYGDRQMHGINTAPIDVPDRVTGNALLSVYFDFAMPTYRFLHRPSVTQWLGEMQEGRPLPSARRAVVWIVLATSAIFDSRAEGHAPVLSGATLWEDAERYYLNAKNALAKATGKAVLESVQSRMAICQHLLHTGRPNEAWFTLGTVVQLALALGLHRARDIEPGESMITHECRKRTFWAVATLDTYLSILLGRPALLHDKDIDQRLPRAIDDDELSAGALAESGKDNMVQASILHAKLARILKRVAQEHNPSFAKSDVRKLEEAARVNQQLDAWQASLPVVLSGVIHPSSLIPLFRRQTMILRLAHAHTLMLVNRPILLIDPSPQLNLQPHIDACLTAAKTTLDMLTGMATEGMTFAAFWFTQYVAFNAVSITYVWLIQRRRGRLSGLRSPFPDEELFTKAEGVQRHFAEAVELNAPSLRYNVVLGELLQEARRLFGKSEPRMERQAFGGGEVHLPLENLANVATAAAEAGAAGLPDTAGQREAFLDASFTELPLDPDLWLQLDSFPFCELQVQTYSNWMLTNMCSRYCVRRMEMICDSSQWIHETGRKDLARNSTDQHWSLAISFELLLRPTVLRHAHVVLMRAFDGVLDLERTQYNCLHW